MANIGRLQISYEWLANVLGFPDGHEITNIIPQNANEIGSRQFSIIVSGPSLPPHIEGAPVPLVNVTFLHRDNPKFD
ncbi:MAG: hypothetical protein KGL39_20275 [Patescibacteria group bacterium]|nr:hypothetical protein [Patescibacteria group bacterium]